MFPAGMELINCKDNSGRCISPEQFNELINKKYGKSDFRGSMFVNANGDLSPTSLGYRYSMDRMTFIRSRIVEQTFYQVDPTDYLTIIPGEGAFALQLITQANIKFNSSFKSGKISSAGQNAKLNIAAAGVLPFYTAVQPWALGTEYSLFDINQALFMGQWDPIEAIQRSRKTEYDLGIQGIAFLGDTDNLTLFPGLFTQPNVNINSTLILENISSMNYTQFGTLVAGINGAFLSNNNQTCWADKFVIPQDDYSGLATPINPQFPTVGGMMIDYLEAAFAKINPNRKVKVLPSAFGMTAYNGGAAGISAQRYVLYRDDIDTLFMELPVPFTQTGYGTINNFNWQDAAYASYTGVQLIKPLEMLYFAQ
jgi:hypothetical protein